MFPELPEIYVPTSEKRHLLAAANDASENKLSIAAFLRAELRRARFCASSAFPTQTVIMNGNLTYRIDWEPESPCCRIVYPDEFSGNDNEISLFSPLGVALLGLKVGDRMPFFTPERGFRLVTAVSAGPPDTNELPQPSPIAAQVAL
jgi:transcription elongation GreA/GreB family factor